MQVALVKQDQLDFQVFKVMLETPAHLVAMEILDKQDKRDQLEIKVCKETKARLDSLDLPDQQVPKEPLVLWDLLVQ